jgi:hypothetical protein
VTPTKPGAPPLPQQAMALAGFGLAARISAAAMRTSSGGSNGHR